MAVLLSLLTFAQPASAGVGDCANGGRSWGGKRSVVDIATGDIDGDGDMEIAIARSSGSNMELEIIDYTRRCSQILYQSSGSIESIAFGDIDGDYRDELAISHGTHYVVLDPQKALFEKRWRMEEMIRLYPPEGQAVTDVAFGNPDGSFRDELAVGFSAGNGRRFQVIDRDYRGRWSLLHAGGEHWDKTIGVSALAFGNAYDEGVDKDELAIGRSNTPDRAMSYTVVRQTGRYEPFETGSNRTELRPVYKTLTSRKIDIPNGVKDRLTVSDMSFGDTDGNGLDELAVAWEPRKRYTRQFQIIGDSDRNYRPVYTDTTSMGSYSVSFGDTDGDGLDELAIGARRDRMEYRVINDALAGYEPILDEDPGWKKTYTVTAIVLADIDGDRHAELIHGRTGRGRNRFKGTRYQIHDDFRTEFTIRLPS